MSAGTFRALCAELAPALRRQRTRMRLPLSVEKRVAIALWKLATAACYRAVGAQFGVGRSTAGAVVLEVCRAIQRVLLRRAVAWPGDARELLAGFGALGLPRCAGALGLAHTPIQCPPRQAADYINARGYYSMALQVLVDHRGRFTHVSAGWPGKAHPARVLRRSGLYRRGQQGALFPAGATPLRVGGVAVPLVVAGSAAHPLLPWLMTPFGEAAGAQGRFDAALARCRQPAERALARLRGRWRCLTARNDCAVDNLPRLVSACCVLHNLCERRGEPFDEAWAAEAQRLGASFQQPEARPEAPAEPTSPGARVRDALCAYMESQAQH
ncbi:putative nuclease HARBI1 [Alligator mississippiensis]|uniref:Nuclease HARBI1 n=1 Tax=Alligator mississippiensis TaxID=8496 RepID=A0A151N463_ALLMI|nr:putative nuclease HARBI1 [Alligator mississippiensis]